MYIGAMKRAWDTCTEYTITTLTLLVVNSMIILSAAAFVKQVFVS